MAPSNYSSASSSDFSNYSSSSAPLPSPSSSQPAQYFPSQPNLHRHRTSISVPQSQAPTSQPQSQSQQQLQQSQQQATQQYGHEPYGGANQTGFCLIAEAAKRAQMEVTMRDMGGPVTVRVLGHGISVQCHNYILQLSTKDCVLTYVHPRGRRVFLWSCSSGK